MENEQQELAARCCEACQSGHLDVVVGCLQQGCDINGLWPGVGIPPLEAAIWADHVNIAHHLLDNGAAAYGYGSPMNAASICGHVDILRRLIDSGAELSGRSMQFAAHRGQTGSVRVLLKAGVEAGADPEIRDPQNQSALTWFSFSERS